MNIPQDLQDYVETEILPRYNDFDAAHRMDHARKVIEQSIALAEMVSKSEAYKNPDGTKIVVRAAMSYAIAAYHDTGLTDGRELHHIVSARIMRADTRLRQWFSEAEIDLMADAVEDHRASSKHAPRSIYGRIVAEADRLIVADDIVRRTIQYGLAHYPALSVEDHYQRTLEHLQEKYGDGGYLHLWIAESENAARLEELRAIIRQPAKALRPLFDCIWNRLHEGACCSEA